MGYAESVWERAMQVQTVVFRAMAGEIRWFRAADLSGVSARTMRRWRERYEQYGPDAFFDRRRETPSRRRASGADLARVLQLYRERYRGFNVRHCGEIARPAAFPPHLLDSTSRRIGLGSPQR